MAVVREVVVTMAVVVHLIQRWSRCTQSSVRLIIVHQICSGGGGDG
jgi:hypothetical protein